MSNQTIFNTYRAAGMTEAGALAMLGNGDCESNNIPYRLQGDFSTGFAASLEYTAAVDSGTISQEQFAADGKGYGLFQWTFHTRKRELWSFARARGASIGAEEMQVVFSVQELKRDFSDLWAYLCSTDDLYRAVASVCREFERPAVNNTNDRYSAAVRIKSKLDLHVSDSPAVCWPPRTVDKSMSGPDVAVLQAVLTARGYYTAGISGVIDDTTDAAIRQFQKDRGLAPDGVAGPLTWGKLLER